MKKVGLFAYLVIALLLGSQSVFADEPRQNEPSLYIGLKAGATLSNIADSKNDKFVSDPRLGYTLGAFVKIHLVDFIGLQPEVLFSQRVLRSSGSYTQIDFTYMRSVNFLDIPIFVTYTPKNHFTFLAGPQFSTIKHQHYKFNNEFEDVNKEKVIKNTTIRKNTLGIAAGVDYNVSNIIVGARVGRDLIHDDGNTDKLNLFLRYLWVQATIGYQF